MWQSKALLDLGRFQAADTAYRCFLEVASRERPRSDGLGPHGLAYLALLFGALEESRDSYLDTEQRFRETGTAPARCSIASCVFRPNVNADSDPT